MAVKKLSEIADGGLFVPSSDQIVSVRDGDTDVLVSLSSFGYPTSMLPTNTGAQNATALMADIGAATGQQIVIPNIGNGQYILAAVSVSSVDVNLWFETGAILIPDSSLFSSGTMVTTSNGAITINNMTVQGNGNGAPIMWRSNTPSFFYAHNTLMYNVGSAALNAPSTTGVYGFLVKGATGPVIIDGWRGVNFNDSNSPGTTASFVRHILLYNNQFCHITNAQCNPGTASTHQVDYIQCLDDQATPTQKVVIDNSQFYYNENIRRCVKQSGGGWVKVDKIDIRLDPSFTPVSGSTNVGTFNLNCIDYSSNFAGILWVTNSYIDGTGFQTTIAQTGGSLAQVIVDNCDIIGGILNVIRNSPDSGAPENQPPVGFFITANDIGSGISNSRFHSGVGCVQFTGSYNYVTDCTFNDPRDYAFITGNTGVDGFEATGNSVITKTPGFLSANGYVSQISNVKNIDVFNNTLYQEGNTTESTTFIQVASSSATGYAGLNVAPAGIIPFDVGTSAVVNILSNNAYPVSFVERTATLIINGQGGVPTTGAQNTSVTIPYNCTVAQWYISADQSGSCVIDIKHSGTSIIGAGNKPTLSSQISANAVPASWTSTTVTTGTIWTFNLDSAATVTNITLTLVLNLT